MRFVALAAIGLLAACDQPAPVANNAATADNDAAANAATPAAASLGVPPATKEAALKLMHDRHENYEKIGDAMKVISRELKGDSPDLARVRAGADTIATLAPQVKTWFPAGTGPDVGKTEAKAEIWQKPEDFAAKARGLEEAAAAFRAAAQGSDVAAIRAAHANLGKSCKACHDLYREDDH